MNTKITAKVEDLRCGELASLPNSGLSPLHWAKFGLSERFSGHAFDPKPPSNNLAKWEKVAGKSM